MEDEKISSFVEYASLIFKKYNELHQIRENNKYRVIKIKLTERAQYKLTIQVIGKASIIECYPEEIVEQDNLIEGFSRKDVQLLTFLAIDQSRKPKYKIVMQDICDKKERCRLGATRAIFRNWTFVKN